MLGPQQKQKQLTSMVNDLTSIKKQLHQLMTPSSEERTTDSQLKSQYHQFKQSSKYRVETQRTDRFVIQQNLQFKGGKSPSGIYQKNLSRLRQDNNGMNESPLKNGKQLGINSSKKSAQKSKYVHALNRISKDKISSDRFNFFQKEHYEKPPKNAFAGLPLQSRQDQELRKRQGDYCHFRHSPQKNLNLTNKLNVQLVDTTHFQKDLIKQQKITERHFVVPKRNTNFASPPSSKSPKRLIRMKSDLIDHSHTLRHHLDQKIDIEWKSSNLRYFKQKIKELQEENSEKQEIIHLLEAQLKEIEANFIEMKHSIAKIIKIGSNSTKSNGEVDITTALKEIVRDLSLQKQELKRLTIDGETWRKLNFQQSLQIKNLNEQLSKFTSINETISQLKEENNTYKDQLINLSSKLQVSSNQNRIKDEFIVKFLMGRGLSSKEEDKIEHLMEILANYLKNCSYPNNKLLDKLNQEQQQIKKLKALLEKDRKNSA